MDKFKNLADSVPDSGKEALEMSEKITASPAFVANFQAVAANYNCPPDEIEIMKQLARADLPAAVECFTAMAGEVN